MSVRVLVLAFSLLVAVAAAAADRASLKEVEKRIEETEREAKAIHEKTEDALGDVDRLDRSISDHERRLTALAADIRGAKSRRDDAERRIAALDTELPRLRASFVGRSRGLYRLTHRGLGPVLFATPREWTETLRYRHALQAVLAHDREIVIAMRENRTAAESARADAASSAAALETSRKENERELAALRGERGKKQQLVASLRGEGAEHARRIGELKASAEKLHQLLEQQEATKQQPFEQRPGAANARMTPPLAVAGGELVVARNGVEVRVAAGTPIHAVKAGRVVYAGWFTGYGKMVILDHGNRLYSIYGYASEIAVEQGQVVEGGDQVASVGATGPVARPSLYFEIRDHGTPRDPGQYIAALART